MPRLRPRLRIPRPLAVTFAAVLAAVCTAGGGLGGTAPGPQTEVVVTLRGAPLSFLGREPAGAVRRASLARIDAQQAAAARRIAAAVPHSRIRWRYRIVLNGFAVVLPQHELGALARVPGVQVWPNLRYHALAVQAGSPQQIGADRLWGSDLASSGQGMKIGIIDDGLDATHPYFDPAGMRYPPGFPKGQTRYTTPKVIVQRAFAPPGAADKYARAPFDPQYSDHATHVAGIAAGDYDTLARGATLVSGVAPRAWLGNYKALSVPTPGFGLDGNSAELAAAIEAAVSDGMNVINLSLGEPEIEPSRDVVVQALEGAAAAGVVPVVAAGNDFDNFGYGTVSSPANAPDAIAVGAATSRNVIASFSSAGPTAVSLEMKPDVVAPGIGVLSSFPGAKWVTLDGTSMAAPAVSGAVALLKQRHPTWTVAELKSALEQTGAPVLSDDGAETLPEREGGGMVDLVRADNPLLFAAPTGLSFGRLGPGVSAARDVTLTDAGGGAGDWTVGVDLRQGNAVVSAPPSVTVPGTLTVTATGGTDLGDDSGFVVLTRGADVRRIPFWFLTSAPRLAGERALALTRPGVYHGTTAGAPSLVTRYRYPTGGDRAYPGPERVYRIRLTGSPANAGVVVLSGHVTPHITFNGSEDHLAGYTGLPVDLNPYRDSFGLPRPVAGLVLPAHGTYDVVFDSGAAGGGPFTFRYWVDDVTPPRLKLVSTRGAIVVSAADAGAGVDPRSIGAVLDGTRVGRVAYADGKITVPARPGRHRLVLTVADYQETKNMEDIRPTLPNTATLRVTVKVT